MLEQDGMHFSERWGYLSRAGLNDKSQFTRQIEKYADIYTSRVSNFLRYTVRDITRNMPFQGTLETALGRCLLHPIYCVDSYGC
jgi:5' nucleotidase family